MGSVRWLGTYQVAVLAVVALYLALWLSQFHYVYGWLTDDWYFSFVKGVATTQDWRSAFNFYVGNGYVNALQPYFFLISYLPLRLGLSLPSYEVPLLGAQTGNFRFFLLYTVFLHAIILAVWAWFATTLTTSRRAAFLSVVLFATSPSLMLWSPNPSSRLLGLPFALVGLWLLLRASPTTAAGRASLATTFAAGTCCWLAQSIHYTALYLVAPVCAVVWALRFWRGWRDSQFWRLLAAFTVGCLWLQAGLEAISYWALGIPLDLGPTASLMQLRNQHASGWSSAGNLALWTEWFRSQMGAPLLLLVVLGWILYLHRQAWSRPAGHRDRLALALAIALALGYLVVSGTMAFFRQTSVLQPFLFLFAGIAIVAIAERLGRRPWQQRGIVLVLLVVAGAIPWVQSKAVFEAQQGLGRALEWAHTAPGSPPLEWLRVAWYDDPTALASPEELAAAPPDALLLTYFPWHFIQGRPSLLPTFEATPPLAAWPSLWDTDAVRAEVGAYYPDDDWRYNPVMSQARVYRVGDVVRAMAGQPLAVASVTADSVATPHYEPVNVFDQDQSPDSATAWVSAASPLPHWLEVRFAGEVTLGDVRVVAPPTDRSAGRIARLEVQVAPAGGDFRTVWSGSDLAPYPVIAASWPPVPTTALRLIVHEQHSPQRPTSQARIEEVTFPGYAVSAPPPARPFPELRLTDVRAGTTGLDAVALEASQHTVLVADGVRLPTRVTGEPGHLQASVPSGVTLPTGEVEVYLTDAFRRSESHTVVIETPVLRDVQPRSAVAGVPFNRQPDGSSTFTVWMDRKPPGTVVMFDGRPLSTALSAEDWGSATIPAALLAQPGAHAIWLSNPFGESERVRFDVSAGP
ncbi:MAG TPA: hypothetical protein VII06_01045 [Chloroflexota bacterium]